MLQKINETKVDIILPNYNSGQFFLETIDSILNQTFKNWQLIIVGIIARLPELIEYFILVKRFFGILASPINLCSPRSTM